MIGQFLIIFALFFSSALWITALLLNNNALYIFEWITKLHFHVILFYSHVEKTSDWKENVKAIYKYQATFTCYLTIVSILNYLFLYWISTWHEDNQKVH